MERSRSAALSNIIVSVAQGVSEANSILNEDPHSQLTISTFKVDTTFEASLSVPHPAEPTSPSEFRLEATPAETYRLIRPEKQMPKGAHLVNWVRPRVEDAALRSKESMSGRVRIEAQLEAVPNVE